MLYNALYSVGFAVVLCTCKIFVLSCTWAFYMQIEYTMKVVVKYCSIYKVNCRSHTVVNTTNLPWIANCLPAFWPSADPVLQAKALSHVTSPFTFTSNIKKGFYGNKWCDGLHLTFTFSRTGRQRSKKNADVTCEWIFRKQLCRILYHWLSNY